MHGRITNFHGGGGGVRSYHRRRGVGIAHFNMATWGVAGGKTPKYVRIAVLFENKVHLKLFQERCKAAPQRISG